MLRIAHRGASGWEPQNTRLSFEKAIELGSDFIETDVHLCRTGELVLCHDARIDSSSNGSGFISEMSFDQLLQFDFGKKQRILRLEDLLEIAEGRCGVNIELKSIGTGRATAEAAAETIQNSPWWEDHLVVTSFQHRELREFQKVLPSIRTGALIKSILLDTAAYLEQMGVSFLVTSIEFIDQDLVDEVHATGREVYVYTVNDLVDIERMQHLGVDGLIGNYPDRFPA
jgi:glycerophosphoryl diester phosphodiesterase